MQKTCLIYYTIFYDKLYETNKNKCEQMFCTVAMAGNFVQFLIAISMTLSCVRCNVNKQCKQLDLISWFF